MQAHMDMRISNIEKIFVTTVAPLVETLDILVRQVRSQPIVEAFRISFFDILARQVRFQPNLGAQMHPFMWSLRRPSLDGAIWLLGGRLRVSHISDSFVFVSTRKTLRLRLFVLSRGHESSLPVPALWLRGGGWGRVRRGCPGARIDSIRFALAIVPLGISLICTNKSK